MCTTLLRLLKVIFLFFCCADTDNAISLYCARMSASKDVRQVAIGQHLKQKPMEGAVNTLFVMKLPLTNHKLVYYSHLVEIYYHYPAGFGCGFVSLSPYFGRQRERAYDEYKGTRFTPD